ncbi:ATP-dependent Clp protease adapter ClpS [Synechococcus sp. CBW1002]|jgi:ATP-dependent Clp protease adaptor protein ClpS|nr:ATP-dependent Clp protease adapter ClpS [Synechococcus sp. CBW1002]QPN66406.1 ATP-dependent Clp protease adapter ClpS [Synechococcus sp. CBW1006]CAK6693991.1 ATP-dependent Clp protease adapter protein ClpS [Synechococcus sp. CBW1107]
MAHGSPSSLGSPSSDGSALPLGLTRATVTTPGTATRSATLLERAPYPEARVVVLDDDINTFQHVVECLVRHIPGMLTDRAWDLAHRIDGEGSAVVWTGPLEQAELYHQLLAAEGLTMAPLQRD